jgi:hypothetical protein
MWLAGIAQERSWKQQDSPWLQQQQQYYWQFACNSMHEGRQAHSSSSMVRSMKRAKYSSNSDSQPGTGALVQHAVAAADVLAVILAISAHLHH